MEPFIAYAIPPPLKSQKKTSGRSARQRATRCSPVLRRLIARRPADRLTFAENETYFHRAESSAASANPGRGRFHFGKKTLIRVANARIAPLRKSCPSFFPSRSCRKEFTPRPSSRPRRKLTPPRTSGPHSVIGDDVHIGARASFYTVETTSGFKSQIGEGTELFPNVTIYPRTQIGKRVRIHSSSVIGADGFGYVLDNGTHIKVPQVGNVVICDDVEIGACVTVDRGALGLTTIGKGSKIDSLVQIGHNVSIGEHALLISQVGIAGSCKLGNYVTIGGQKSASRAICGSETM